MLDRRCRTARCGARWSMTAIDNSSVVSDTLSRRLGLFDGLRLVRIDQAW
jgi:hypothetical protein